MKSVSFEELSENLCQWQAIRDSVFNHVRQDTVGIHGQDLRKTCEGIHDSLRLSFRVWLCQGHVPYQELFLLKENFHLMTRQWINPDRGKDPSIL